MFSVLKKKFSKKEDIQQKNKKTEIDDSILQSVVEKTGWTREYAAKQMEDAKNRIGINYKDYAKKGFYSIPVEMQEEKYQKILKKRAEKKAQKEKCINAAMEKMGWEREYAISHVKAAKEKIGINYKDYYDFAFYTVSNEEQEQRYKEILAEKEQKKKKKEQRIEKVIEKTGWSREYAVERMNAAKKIGINYKDFVKHAFYDVPEEEWAERLTAIKRKKAYKKARKEEREVRKNVAAQEREEAIVEVMKATGWSRETTEEKIKEAAERTGCSRHEYFIYRFYELSDEMQNELFLTKKSGELSKKFNTDKELVKILCNKELTNNYFAEYIARPWCVNIDISFEEFAEKFANSNRIFYKPLGGHAGQGTKSFYINKENIKSVYDEMMSFPKGIIEEYVVQHSKISELAPSAVNTVRIVTISSNTQPVLETGEMFDIPYVAVKMSGKGAIADNLASGAVIAAVNKQTGEIMTDGVDGKGNVYTEHPASGIKIKGFEIPYFSEAVKMVTTIIKEKKMEGYLGWDISITENGPVLIEANLRPGVVLLTMPYLATKKKGMKTFMEKYL